MMIDNTVYVLNLGNITKSFPSPFARIGVRGEVGKGVKMKAKIISSSKTGKTN